MCVNYLIASHLQSHPLYLADTEDLPEKGTGDTSQAERGLYPGFWCTCSTGFWSMPDFSTTRLLQYILF